MNTPNVPVVPISNTLQLSSAEQDMLRMWLPDQISSLERAVKADEAWHIWQSQLDAARLLLEKIS